jgi:hypothetical protein
VCNHCGWDQDYEVPEEIDDVEEFDLDGELLDADNVQSD